MLVLNPMLLFPVPPPTAVAQSAAVSPVSATLSKTAVRLSLDPEALAAAGVPAGQVGGVVSTLRSHLAAHGQEIEQTETAAQAAEKRRADLERLARPGQPGADQLALDSATQAATASMSALTALLDASWSSATASLSPAQTATLAAIRRNRPRSVPVMYLVVDRADAEWEVLKGALTARQAGAGRPNAEAERIVAAAEQNPAVVSARNGVASSIASVTAAWRGAMSPH